MKKYFANLAVLTATDYGKRALPVALTPKMHPAVLLMTIISYFEDRSAICPRTKNHVIIFFFIEELWKTDPTKCIEFLVNFFYYLAGSKIDLFYGGGFSREEVFSLISKEQIFYGEELSIDLVGDFGLPSVSHDIFRRFFEPICTEIPDLRSRLLEILGDDFAYKGFISSGL